MHKTIAILLFALPLLVAGGCRIAPKTPGLSHALASSTMQDGPGGALSVLSWVGGISTLAGIAALILTRGAMGLRAIFAGISMCIIAYAVSVYAHLIFIPIAITIGVVSIFYGGWTIYKTILKRKCNKSC